MSHHSWPRDQLCPGSCHRHPSRTHPLALRLGGPSWVRTKPGVWVCRRVGAWQDFFQSLFMTTAAKGSAWHRDTESARAGQGQAGMGQGAAEAQGRDLGAVPVGTHLTHGTHTSTTTRGTNTPMCNDAPQRQLCALTYSISITRQRNTGQRTLFSDSFLLCPPTCPSAQGPVAGG